MIRKKQKKDGPVVPSTGFEHLSTSSDLYSGRPAEKHLYDRLGSKDSRSIAKTGRHRAETGARKVADPRDKMALIAILKSTVLILLLVVAFFMLWKGISLWEERVWIQNAPESGPSPVMQPVQLLEEFDIRNAEARARFGERIQKWQAAEQAVGTADALLQRKIYDQAIDRCQDALRLDPAYVGALERLGTLYFAKGDYVEAVNAYIRLLSIDPSRQEMQKNLIKSLDAYGDSDSVLAVGEWYQARNGFDIGVQRYLANALYAKGEFEKAADAYARVLVDAPNDVQALERQASSFMQLKQYDKAIVPLASLRDHDYRNMENYKQLAICHAQLQQPDEAVETLGRAAQLFGEKIVIGWMQDPQLDPIRTDRTFQALTDRVGGEEFRKWLEKMASSAESQKAAGADIGLKLEMPNLKPEQDVLKQKKLPSSP